jgi:large conductance mechanosensitive channel
MHLMRTIAKEFKEFALRGNVADMAVGIIVGGAFGKIVSSLVTDIIMPPVGLMLGGVDFSRLSISLRNATDNAQAVTLNYGLFVNTVIDFLIIAFSIFIMIKQINRLKKKSMPSAPKDKECPYCISKIPLKATKCAFCSSKVSAI